FTGRRLDAAAAAALGLLTRVAPADEAEAAALELAAEVAANPPEGVRRIKALFRELGDDAARVARENAVLDEFQAHGAGLPQGRS
ncbi:MAG: enoyl-CoA hydratase/isomerase family protein, partial [Actinomycetota bacterium]|nr:enoyl-CoA hydratase/isomerase family protein [Actinomycetota bacterium]